MAVCARAQTAIFFFGANCVENRAGETGLPVCRWWSARLAISPVFAQCSSFACFQDLTMRVFNFSAGPAAMPEEVLRQAAAEMLDWQGSGMSVMEMSHRGKEFMAIHEEALVDLRELLEVPASHRILFLQGGGLGENAIVPMNLMGAKPRADFVVTGSWSQKSFKEAQKYGSVHLAATGKTAEGYTRAPARSEWQL